MRRVAGSEGPEESFDARWSGGAAGLVSDLEGYWRVERLSGSVPMPGVYKEMGAGRGRTTAAWSPFPDLPFGLQRREGSVLLVYDPPFSVLRDELRREHEGSWLGKATVAGRRYAWFRMVPAVDER